MTDPKKPTTEEVDHLLERYVEAHVLQGIGLDPEVLCRESPELLEPLRECIREYQLLEKALNPSGSVPVGRTVLHYRIVERLGAGAMGEVYVAEDLKLGRRVALKILPAQVAIDPERLKRFHREARIVAALNHPNIVTIHAVEEAEGIHFLTMELVDGETLEALIPPEGLEPVKTMEITKLIARALAAAHEEGIIHRDLKPSNIMVTANGRVKVLDFGLAKLQEVEPPLLVGDNAAEPQATQKGQVLGTISYMSPEQARGETLDTRSDVFSLGALTYEMATGRRPFAGESSADVLVGLLDRRPPLPSRVNPRIPTELEAIILRCLAKERQQRYSSARELALDLEQLEAVGAIQPAIRKRSRLLTVGATAALVATVALAVFFVARERTKEATLSGVEAAPRVPNTVSSIAVLPFVDMSPERDLEYFSDGLATELLNVLAQVRSLRVAGRVSSFQFKGQDEDPRVIGKRLNVETILEGSVRKAGERVRITVELVSAADGFQIWSGTYDRTLEDILALQEEIARSVVEALEGKLEGPELPALRSRTVNAQAYKAYLQGRHLTEIGGEDNFRRAIDYYEEALAIDSSYALAWVGLAQAHLLMTGQGLLPTDEGFQQAREAAHRAIDLDNTLAEAWAALGSIRQLCDFDWQGANTAFQRAIELEPTNPSALGWASELAAVLGRFDEAIALARRAAELDPLSVRAHRNLGRRYYVAGRQEEAELAYRRAQELNPESVNRMLGEVYLAQSRPEAALAAMERETNPFYRRFGLALAYHALGRQDEAQATLAMMIEKSSETGAYQIAQIYAFRGESDPAFAWLERAWVQRDPGLPGMRVPHFEGLHDDPRWAAFLAKLGLAE